MVLADWGKGGYSGNILESSISSKPYDIDDNYQSWKNGTVSGSSYTYQVAIAKAMGDWATTSNPKPTFLIAGGDNFYTNGVSSASDSLWESLWSDVYLGYDALNIPWYPVFGNHDYGYGVTGVRAQLDRTSQNPDGAWQFPATNYTKSFDIPGGGRVQIIFVDTTTLAPSENKCCNTNGGISQELQAERIADQLMHVTRMLEETVEDPPTWLLMVGHYPIFSMGSHGDTEELLTYLYPLLKQYNVHAYICGHDHISEHLSHEGIEYFVAGAGSMTDSLGKYTSQADLLWYGVGYSAFSVFEATKRELRVQYLDYKQEIKYEYTLTNPLTNPNHGRVPDAVKQTDGDRNGKRFSVQNFLTFSASLFAVVVMLSVGLGLMLTRSKTLFSLQPKQQNDIYAVYDCALLTQTTPLSPQVDMEADISASVHSSVMSSTLSYRSNHRSTGASDVEQTAGSSGSHQSFVYNDIFNHITNSIHSTDSTRTPRENTETSGSEHRSEGEDPLLDQLIVRGMLRQFEQVVTVQASPPLRSILVRENAETNSVKRKTRRKAFSVSF